MIPLDVQRVFARAIREAKSGLLEQDYILPQYWIRIEQWNQECLMILDDPDAPDALQKAFKNYIDDMFRDNGFREVKTVWVDNGDTIFGSSVTLFRKTRGPTR